MTRITEGFEDWDTVAELRRRARVRRRNARNAKAPDGTWYYDPDMESTLAGISDSVADLTERDLRALPYPWGDEPRAVQGRCACERSYCVHTVLWFRGTWKLLRLGCDRVDVPLVLSLLPALARCDSHVAQRTALRPVVARVDARALEGVWT